MGNSRTRMGNSNKFPLSMHHRAQYERAAGARLATHSVAPGLNLRRRPRRSHRHLGPCGRMAPLAEALHRREDCAICFHTGRMNRCPVAPIAPLILRRHGLSNEAPSVAFSVALDPRESGLDVVHSHLMVCATPFRSFHRLCALVPVRL